MAALAPGSASRSWSIEIITSISQRSRLRSIAQSAGDSGPANAATTAIGVTRKLTHGIASAFATGPMSDKVEKSATAIGASPTVAAHWLVAAARRLPATEPIAGRASIAMTPAGDAAAGGASAGRLF